jgi:hypothetical protein
MYILRQLEHALDECWEATTGELQTRGTKFAIYAWDEAVAYYVGSTESLSEVDGHGVLWYTLADQLCLRFRTCGESSSELSGAAFTNIRILRAFRIGQNDIKYGHCDAATEQKEQVEQWMIVPLLQSTLEQLYELILNESNNSGHRRMEIMGTVSVLLASIAPFIHACHEEDAKILQQHVIDMLSSPMNTPLERHVREIQRIIEKQYPCFGISCEHVGTLLHAPYYGQICQKETNPNMAVIIVVGMLSFLIILFLVGRLVRQRYYRRQERRTLHHDATTPQIIISETVTLSMPPDEDLEHVIL